MTTPKMLLEASLDALPGPTHHYGGHAWGNVASMHSANQRSYPRRAALQSLEKMRLCAELGIPQLILPPQQRPLFPVLQALGFRGTDRQILEKAYREAPHLLSACYSSSWMWTANWATISPSCDTYDGKVHITPANLISNFHRAVEVPHTHNALQKVFRDPRHFVVHPPLYSCDELSDEGAANHTRFCSRSGEMGIHLFVYGREGKQLPFGHYPPRQTKMASEAIARCHGLHPNSTIFAQQNPFAIDMGVFHNDVASVGCENFFLLHEAAFKSTDRLLEELQIHSAANEIAFHPHVVTEKALPLKEAVKCYLFNSQIVTDGGGNMVLLAPIECRESPRATAVIEDLVAGSSPIKRVIFVDLTQSMCNGGGPACLRLRIPLAHRELRAIAGEYWLTPDRYTEVKNWIERFYRESLTSGELGDPQLAEESAEAVEAFATMQMRWLERPTTDPNPNSNH